MKWVLVATFDYMGMNKNEHEFSSDYYFFILDIYNLVISGGVSGCNDTWHGDLIQKSYINTLSQMNFVDIWYFLMFKLTQDKYFVFFPNLDV